jgi:hypothetical protein
MPSHGKVIASVLAILLLLSVDGHAEESSRSKSGDYPVLEDAPPKPASPTMTADEVLKLKKDLSSARDRQISKGKATEGAVRAPPAKP